MTIARPHLRCLLTTAMLAAPSGVVAQGYPIWTAPIPAVPLQPIAGIADLNGDGVRDLIQGSIPLVNGPVELISGQDGSLIRSVPAPPGSAWFGYAVAAYPDADGDGLDDVLVGDPFAGVPAVSFGVAYIVSSFTGAVLRTIAAPAGTQSFGAVVAAADDLDGDGEAEVLVTAWTPTQVSVVSGLTGTVLNTFAGAGPSDGYGTSLLDAGDVDGDGSPDLALGVTEPGQSLNPPSVPTGTGFVELRSGATGALLWTMPGSAIGDAFGWSMARTADLDGDSLADILVGAPQFHPCSDMTCHTGAGYAVVLSAATGAVLRTMNGTVLAEEFGYSVAAISDLDGDGIDDLVVGAPGNDQAYYADFPGAAHIHSGATGARIAVVDTTPAQFAGQDVVALGDANGDGVPDLATGPSLQAISVVGLATGDVRVGTACAGTGGDVPRLATFGGAVEAAGNGDFGLAVSNGRPLAPAALFIATAINPPGVPFGTCGFFLDGVIVPALPWTTLSSNGLRLMPFAVPMLSPALVGVPYGWQALVLDPLSSNGLFTLTDAVVTTVQ